MLDMLRRYVASMTTLDDPFIVARSRQAAELDRTASQMLANIMPSRKPLTINTH